MRVLALDLRGHGLSEGARSGLDLDSLAWDALTVLAANGAGQEVGGPPAVIAGHGLGAMVAATRGSAPAGLGRRPRARRRWLGGPGCLDPPEPAASSWRPSASHPRCWRPWMPSWPTGATSIRAPGTRTRNGPRRAQVDQKHAGHVALVTRQATLRGLVEAMFGYRPIDTLAAAPAPLLVLVAGAGTADDEMARERELALEDVLAARAAAGLPAARVVRLPGTGHNLMRYRPADAERRAAGAAESTPRAQPDVALGCDRA